MKKPFLYTMRKNVPSISIILLIIAGIIIAGAIMTMKLAAQLPPPKPWLCVHPTGITVSAPGQKFTVEVNITECAPVLQGYEFKLKFNQTILNVTGADSYGRDTEGNVVPGAANPAGTSYGPATIIDATLTWTPLQNVTYGFVWCIAMFPIMSPQTNFNATIMTINFTALAVGNSTLDLYDTALANPIGNPITHAVFDGWANVIPEFPTAIIAPLLMITTLTAAFLGKIVWSKKRRDQTVT